MSKRTSGTYLTDLFVKNARSFKGDHHLVLKDPNGGPSAWTLVLGENGVGKTTLLQCLAHLAPNKNTDAPSGTLNPVFFLEPVGIAYTESVERLGRNGDIDFEIRANYATGATLGSPLQRRSKSVELGVTFSRRKGKVLEFEPIVSHIELVEPLVLSYGAGRRMGVGNLESAADATEMSSLFDDNKLLVDAEELLQQLDYAALKENSRSSKRHFEVFIRMMAALLPDVASPANIVVYGPSPVRKGALSGVHVRVPYGEVPLRQLSFGYQTMAAWLSDIAWRLFKQYPSASNPLNQPAIVLVDEIDLHLHPMWQRKLRQLLANHFPAVQFIATAHSPLMAQANMRENLAVVQRNGDGVTIENDPAVVGDWRLDQVITSELFRLPPWPPEVDQDLERQRVLANRVQRSAAEDAELAEIEARILKLPTGAAPADERSMDIIRRAADAFRTAGLPTP